MEFRRAGPIPRAGRTDRGTTTDDGSVRRGCAALEVGRSRDRPIGRVNRHAFDPSMACLLGSLQRPSSGDCGTWRHIEVGAKEDHSSIRNRTDHKDI